MEAERAKIAIGGVGPTATISPSEAKVVFTVDLKAGPTTLEATFTLPNGKERGAYFVYVTRI